MAVPRVTAEGGGMTAVRGALLSYTGDPFERDLAEVRVHLPDGIVAFSDGRIAACGPAAEVLPTLPPGTPVVRYADALLLPGFLDTHVHYPQIPVIAGPGGQLLEWLARYAFPAEERCADAACARDLARVFLGECLRNGITTCATYGTVHPGSVDVFFEEAEALGMRAIAGKVMMDRDAPRPLLDTAASSYEDSKRLIERWHGRGRALYAVAPRFAPTSTPAQLEAAGALLREHPGVYLQTHLAENGAEVDAVRRLFPACRDYLDVYERYGLVRPRAIFGHGIHLSDDELRRLSASGAAIAHCPTSNQFLGSGLFDLRRARDRARPVRVGLATDLGAGTTFSILGTLGVAYKTAQLRGFTLTPGEAFYLATRGSAAALYLEDRIGSLAPGMEADLTVLDLHSTPLIRFRMQYARDLDEALFIQMMLGDDRAVRATYVAGKLAYARPVSA